MGAVSPVGNSAPESWELLRSGRGGIAAITHFDASKLPVRIAGEVKGFDAAAIFGTKEARRGTPHVHFAMAAAREAVLDSRLDIAAEFDRSRRLDRVRNWRPGSHREDDACPRPGGGAPRVAVRRRNGARRHGTGHGVHRCRRPRAEHGGGECLRLGRRRHRTSRELGAPGRRCCGARRRYRGGDHVYRNRDVRRSSRTLDSQRRSSACVATVRPRSRRFRGRRGVSGTGGGGAGARAREGRDDSRRIAGICSLCRRVSHHRARAEW